MATTMTKLTATPKVARQARTLPTEKSGRSTPIDRRDLPRIDGTGLTLEEWFRTNGARNQAMYLYARDMPEATPGEIDAVGDRAATDALRAVLRDRPAAPSLPAAPCCPAGESAPCVACETTATVPTPQRSRRPARTPQGTCRLSLTINGTRYAVKPVLCDRQAARQCFEIRKKADGTMYHVSRHDYGAECTCADFVFNRDGIDPMGCKHIRSLAALGILDTRPARTHTPPPSAWNDDQEAAAESWPSWTDSARYAVTR